MYDITVQILAVLTILRIVWKVLVPIVSKAIENSEDKKDDVKWAKIQASWWFKVIEGLLDYVVGIKLNPPKK